MSGKLVKPPVTKNRLAAVGFVTQALINMRVLMYAIQGHSDY
jgi:hypothetical protein